MRTIRRRHGLTQRQLAARLHLTQSALSRLETGQRTLSAQLARSFVLALQSTLPPADGRMQRWRCTHCGSRCWAAAPASWCPHCGYEGTLRTPP